MSKIIGAFVLFVGGMITQELLDRPSNVPHTFSTPLEITILSAVIIAAFILLFKKRNN